MKNWVLPITVLGLSGLGLLFASERARTQMRGFFDRLASSGDPLGAFNKAIENELENIQRALDQLANALET